MCSRESDRGQGRGVAMPDSLMTAIWAGLILAPDAASSSGSGNRALAPDAAAMQVHGQSERDGWTTLACVRGQKKQTTRRLLRMRRPSTAVE